MTSSHKRSALDRDATFYAPKVSCFACYDTGIVTNGDGLLNHYLPDYDAEIIDGNIHRHGGSDLAVICHCVAAYDAQDYDAQTTRAGFRDSTGVRTTDTNGRQQALGVNVDKDIIREIHRQRRANWEATATRSQFVKATGALWPQPQLPAYIADVKEQLRNVEQLLPSID